MDAHAWLHLRSFPHHFWIVHTELNICVQDKQLSPYNCLINSTVSAAVFPNLKQNLMFAVCSMPLLWPCPLTTCTTWCRISRHAQRVALRCCQITDEGWSHGWHALLLESTSILVKIKSVWLYNCWTVYVLPGALSQVKPFAPFQLFPACCSSHSVVLFQVLGVPLFLVPWGFQYNVSSIALCGLCCMWPIWCHFLSFVCSLP